MNNNPPSITPSKELIKLSNDILETFRKEDLINSFLKTGRTVTKTTVRQVQKGSLLGVKPVTYLQQRGELEKNTITY